MNIKKSIGRLHFITYQEVDKSPSKQALDYCAGGGNWVQLRIKNEPKDKIIAEAKKCLSVCMQYGASLIINDYVDIAASIDADGVHLGKNDANIAEAREILGAQKIIGATANTFEDIKILAEKGVDYIGLGPFKFTNTKKNLSPVLGLDGYTNILNKCKEQNINIPIIAIGGIIPADISSLFETGIYGLALSSYLAKHENTGLETLQLLADIGKYQSKQFSK
jgi:thiamine-phosphate pyrophosphorylase